MISLLEDEEELSKQRSGRWASSVSVSTGTGHGNAVLMGGHLGG